jgi:hypothetical protein
MLLALLGLSGSLTCATPAGAELAREGDLIASFDGSLAPTKLPRRVPAPVTVSVAGDFKTARGASLPQLRSISVAVNRSGRLYDRGLPTCEVRAIQPATEHQARAECRDAIIGSGNVTLQARIASQSPFPVRARVLIFNGAHRDGKRLILAQAYSKDPPGAFILTFRVKKTKGVFGTVLSTSLPRSARQWAYLTHFDMTLGRTYRHGGERRSYVSAACAAPPGFPGALFPFARATYRFDNGQQLRTTVARTCHVLPGG